jgi:membrane-associated phospholipid phosphatase
MSISTSRLARILSKMRAFQTEATKVSINKRDSVVWVIVLIGGAASYITSHFDKFPWIPASAQGIVEMFSVLAVGVGGKFGMSALDLSAEGKAKFATEANKSNTPTTLPPTAAAFLLVLLLPATAGAQVGTEPTAWTAAHRSLADGISSALVGVQAGATVTEDWRLWKGGEHTPTYRAGCSIALAVGVSEILKRLVHETRPDGSGDDSWPSGHSAALMALSGWNFTFGVPVAVAGGLLRSNANRHHLFKDVVPGFMIGAGAQAACSALIR